MFEWLRSLVGKLGQVRQLDSLIYVPFNVFLPGCEVARALEKLAITSIKGLSLFNYNNMETCDYNFLKKLLLYFFFSIVIIIRISCASKRLCIQRKVKRVTADVARDALRQNREHIGRQKIMGNRRAGTICMYVYVYIPAYAQHVNSALLL